MTNKNGSEVNKLYKQVETNSIMSSIYNADYGKILKDLNMDSMNKIFGTQDVAFVPQADFHIDLFLRPLKNGKILVADDEMSLNFLK